MPSAFDYSSMTWTKGQQNPPGIRDKVYFIPKRHITGWPTIDTEAETAQAAVTYVGSFTLAAEKTWLQLDVNPDKSPVTCEPQGEDDSKTFLNKATFKFPGTHEEAAAFAMKMNNDDMVFLVHLKHPNKYRVIGSELWRTRVSNTIAIGAAPTDEKGITIEVECSDIAPAPFYDGAIITEDGDVNPSS